MTISAFARFECFDPMLNQKVDISPDAFIQPFDIGCGHVKAPSDMGEARSVTPRRLGSHSQQGSAK